MQDNELDFPAGGYSQDEALMDQVGSFSLCDRRSLDHIDLSSCGEEALQLALVRLADYLTTLPSLPWFAGSCALLRT